MSWIKRTADGITVGLTGEKVGFHGATPVVKRASVDQAVVVASAVSAVATTGATNSTPFGFSEAQANAIIALVNDLKAKDAAMATLVNELRAALIAKGLIKGAA